MLSPSPDLQACQPLARQLVVFTGKLSSFSRKDAAALVVRLGGSTASEVSARTTLLVIGGEGFGPTADRSAKLKRADELMAQGSAIRILKEAEFCKLAGVPSDDALRQQYYALRDLLARYRSLREDQLRYLMKVGVIQPVVRTHAETFFAFPDLSIIKQANDELGNGAPFDSIVRNLMASRLGQLAFNFRVDAPNARVIKLRSPKASKAPGGDVRGTSAQDAYQAESYFRVASALDDGDETRQGEAATAYRRALELDPNLVPALINLANIHYSCDELIEAQTLYERAIGLEPTFFEAHFNLANIYHDLGRLPEAEKSYRAALGLHPTYADAHFYLAVVFEKMGLPEDARPHWRSYRQLAPLGEWVELAKEFSD